MDIVKMRTEQLHRDYASCGYPETVSEICREELMLPMQDGKCMRTILYKPVGMDRYPVILRRTCYPQDEPLIVIDAENFARRGYWGLSYAALTGWAFADAVKGKVDSMFLLHYGTDRFVSAYHKGLFHHDILTGWSMQNAGRPVEADYETSCRYMPHIEVDEALWGGKLPGTGIILPMNIRRTITGSRAGGSSSVKSHPR